MPQLGPGAIVLDLLKEVVDKGDAVGIERQADAIGLLAAEGLAGNLVLTGLADQGALLHVVIDDVGIDAALLECLAGLLVGLELLLAGLGGELLQDGGAVGAGLDGDVLVGQVVDALDVVVIGEHQDSLLGVVVGTGKGDEFLALVSDGVGGKDGVDLAVLQDGLARVRGHLGDLDFVLAQNVVGQELCDTGVEAAGLAVFLVEEGEKRRGLNATDLKDAGVLDGRGPGAGGDGIVIGLGAIVDELIECLSVERGGSLGIIGALGRAGGGTLVGLGAGVGAAGKTKAGDGGRIFGSITSKDIAEALQAQHGIEIDKKKIQLDAPIKQTGELEVGLKLYYEVNARLKVIVEAE